MRLCDYSEGFMVTLAYVTILYHRLMTNLGERAEFTGPNGTGTLSVQAEWYTELLYKKQGKKPSEGRFDIGLPYPDELASDDPALFVAIECGRNKRPSGLLQDLNTEPGIEEIRPSDICKLMRESLFCGLKHGYAVEVYEGSNHGEDLFRRLHSLPMPTSAEGRGLRVAILQLKTGDAPRVYFYPENWGRKALLHATRFRTLQCVTTEPLKLDDSRIDAPPVSQNRRGRITRDEFLRMAETSMIAGLQTFVTTAMERLGEHSVFVFGPSSFSISDGRRKDDHRRLIKVDYRTGTVLSPHDSIKRALKEQPLSSPGKINVENESGCGFWINVLPSLLHEQ